MHLILNAVNGNYLRDITENHADQTEEVWAAVAYATDSRLLFEWCLHHKIPLRFFGRLDDAVAVSVPILKLFLRRQSPSFVCRLVQYHHAKVIWWRGVGVYIGSANLTDSAWVKNVEAGCFIREDELDDEIAHELMSMFATLEAHATPLTEEAVRAMEARQRALSAAKPSADSFWASPSFKLWSGLVHTGPANAEDRHKSLFLEEWHSTLQELRDIAALVSRPENRPPWVSPAAPAGAQADQFLHAHYYQRTFEGQRANYAAYFEQNRNRREKALSEAIDWWKSLPKPPSSEGEMLNSTAPFLKTALTPESIDSMSAEDFLSVCSSIHAIRDYARRVRNQIVGLPDGTAYSIPEKLEALAAHIWNANSSNGARVKRLLKHILYGGPSDRLPERLWQAIADPNWKMECLGVSALGELVGWALPDEFPPRNGRTSKALKSLGYDVTIHV